MVPFYKKGTFYSKTDFSVDTETFPDLLEAFAIDKQKLARYDRSSITS
jgi:hypothetical protein